MVQSRFPFIAGSILCASFFNAITLVSLRTLHTTLSASSSIDSDSPISPDKQHFYLSSKNENTNNAAKVTKLKEPAVSSSIESQLPSAPQRIKVHFMRKENATKKIIMHTEGKVRRTFPAPGRLYLCGYVGPSEFERTRILFPRYNLTSVPRNPSDMMSSPSDSNDILVSFGGVQPTCAATWTSPEHFYSWASTFPGKILFINGESRDIWRGPTSFNLFRLGYYAESNEMAPTENTIQMTFLQIVLLQRGADAWKTILDHRHKVRSTKERFMIYAASNCVHFREAAVDRLADIAVVDKGGQCWGNKKMTERFRDAPPELADTTWDHNAEHFQPYRFCLVMENFVQESYVTEKLLNAFMGGCIPIYYGSRTVFEMFNKDAFVFYDIENPEVALARVRELEFSPEAYNAVMEQPILANREETIEKYFSFTADIGQGNLINRIHRRMGLIS
jgi:hypothetical protein